MSHTLTIRIDDALAAWLAEAAKRTGIPQGRIVREQLEKARAERAGVRTFMRLAGAIDGPSDLSARRGFSTR